MKKNLLKSILMTVALVFGVTGAWADEITATLVHTASSYCETDNSVFISKVDAEKEHINNSKFTGTWAGAAYAEFSIAIPDGQTIQSATLTWNGVGSSKNRTTDVMYANADQTLDYDAMAAGDAKVDLGATKITTVSFPASKTTNFTTDVTDAVKGSAGQGYVIFKFTNNAGGGDLVGKGAAEGAPVLTITTTDASAMTSYTVKFTDAAGTELKEAATYDVLIGNQATASAADMAAFFNADNTMKYIYVSGNQNITAAEDAASNVITLVFREAEKYAYVIKSSLGGTIKEGSDWEGETLNIAYPRYLAQDGTLYSSSKGSAGWYLKTIDLNQNNVEATIDYTAGESGVVFLAEAEDIETLTVSTAANSDVRCSNGLGAYNAGEGDALITNLPNGKYKLYTSTWGGTGVTFTFKAGETTIGTFDCLGSIKDYNTEEFELNAASTPITLGATSNAARCIDFVYIIKTGDAELAAPVAATGKMTFDGQPTSNNSTDGDITEDKTIDADEFSITISPKTSGSTNNRFWLNGTTTELRIYNGTLTVKAAAGKTLNKVVFEKGSKWGGMTASVGTIDAQTWTGEAEEVVFTVTSQCQIKSITVGDYVAPVEPLAEAANIAAFKALEKDTKAALTVNGAKVTFSNGDNTFIEDETGALLLYKTGLTLTAGKAITGIINGAYTDYKDMPELTAIDETAASEFTEEDVEVKGTVMTLAEAATKENVGKLVTLENVTINADLQIITQGEGGEEYAFYDKFKVMTDFTYPEVIKSIDCILYVTNGIYTVHPVSPESVVAGIVITPCKEITEDYVFPMTAENVAKAIEETWAKGGATRADNKKGTVDPETGETVEATAFPGIGLKKGNSSKAFSTCIKGASKVIAYGATGSGTAARYIMVTATPTEGEAVTAKELSQPNNSAVVELELDGTKEYTIEYTGVEEDGTTGGDVALHGVKFIAATAAETMPVAANIAAAKEEGMRDKEIKLNVTGAKVTLYGGNSMMESFIDDETGALMVDFNISKLLGEDGVTLTGYIIGKVTKDQRQGGVFTFEGTENTATSEITKEAAEIVPTTTTIADINSGLPSDVTSKYVRLENVNVKYEDSGWSADIHLVDGDQEILVNDAMWALPADMSIVEKFNSISGVVIYGYYGYEFVPYGAYDAVEKKIEFTEVANIAALKDVANGTDIKLALNNTQIKVLEGGRWDKSIFIEDETAGIQIVDNDGTIFTELGQTFNGYIYLKYMDEYGVKNLETAGYTKNSEYTVEVKDVVAKEVAWADATSENYNLMLIKVNNIELVAETFTEGEGDDAYSYNIYKLKSGDKEMGLSDMFSKMFDENGGEPTPGMYNFTGIIMNVDDVDYFMPTVAPEAVTVAEGRMWQFDAMSEADEALLAADTEHWTVNKYRYQNNGIAFDNEVIKVNGVELEVTKGLLFTAEAGKLLLGSGVNGSNHFMQVQKGSSFVVTNLAVGDTVRMVVQTSDKNEATVEAPATSVANIIEGFEPSKDKHVCTLVMCEAGSLTLKGANHDLRFMSLEVKAGNPNEVANLRKWDFTAWSEETKANLAADAATVVPTEGEDGTLTYPTVTPWRTYEKVEGPTEKDPDRGGAAYWYGTAISGAEELTANSVVIAETKGLLFNTVAAGALAIAIDYQQALSTYEGPSYLWIGGKNNSLTIPNVKSGAKITMGVESHKTTDARGVKLTINGEELGQAVPKTYEVFDFTVPGELTDNVLSDVVLTNTNGCHIYFITVDATGKTEDAINEVKAVVKTINNDVYTINGVKVRNAGESLEGLAKGLYIIGGKKVVVK